MEQQADLPPIVRRFDAVFYRLRRDLVSPDVAAQVALHLVTDEDAEEQREAQEGRGAGLTAGGLVPPGAEAGGATP